MLLRDLPRWLILADSTISVEVNYYEAQAYAQSYEPVGGSVRLRMMNGDGVKQTNWSRILTTVSGNGCVPVGLSALDYSQPILISCGAPRHKASNTNVVAIPAEHRTDGSYAPTALKLVEDFWRVQPFTNNGLVYTITPDPQAVQFRMVYYPKFNAIMDDPSEDTDWGQAESSWSFTAEEI
jgi:hypothetical protein